MIRMSDLSYCLRSSFFWPQYQVIAHQVDAILQEKVEPYLTWQTLQKLLKSRLFEAFGEEKNEWFSILQSLSERVRSFEGLKTTHAWFLLIQEALQIVGWPGFVEASQVENHLLAGWQQVLQEYLKLDQLLEMHTFDVAK